MSYSSLSLYIMYGYAICRNNGSVGDAAAHTMWTRWNCAWLILFSVSVCDTSCKTCAVSRQGRLLCEQWPEHQITPLH